jgi:hypothetical protein
VPVIIVATLSADTPPVIVPEYVGTVQLYTTSDGTMPLVPSVGVTVNVMPLHVTVLIGTISGVGGTYTVTVNILPTQVPDFGTTLYVAVNIAFVRFNNLPVIMVGLSVADAPPVIVPDTDGGSQLYTIFPGTIPFVSFVGVTTNVMPLHTVVLIATTSGVGFTNTVTVNIAPVQLPDFGVTLYVAVLSVFVRFNNVPVIIVG